MPECTDGSFTCKDWQESVVAGEEGGARLARATVINAFTGVITAAETACTYSISYAADGTGAFSGFERCEGTVDGREGTFVLREWGTFDTTGTVHCSLEVLPGSAGGGLAGLRGTGAYTASPGETSISYTFDGSFAAG
ncbi:DUF3224 domain-containing protein [Streptomyces sp. MP131-18]|uniref:DUF3224 domain-containing protein n=1 Tax=Streptomyces sp. MP131-18 TaxID=1857892 RepID=UPI00097BD795|nr:DUF3224 domain-containing protein [Streptomyces sp. MP131-18]ONK15916.1 hypothetical protein STBA_67590 [Streptomyces sp. MP131-18]